MRNDELSADYVRRASARLKAIDTRTVQAIASNTVDARQKPYFDHLAKLAGETGTFAGFKIIREESAGESAEQEAAAEIAADVSGEPMEPVAAPAGGSDADGGTADANGGEGGDEEERVLYWFFFRVAAAASQEPLIAWESTSRSGRATYLFRESALASSAEAAADRLARGLALVNFKREPIVVVPRFRS